MNLASIWVDFVFFISYYVEPVEPVEPVEIGKMSDFIFLRANRLNGLNRRIVF